MALGLVVNPLLFLTPAWILFELWQLVVAEGYLGVARLREGVDPRTLPLGSFKAGLWIVGILGEWLWLFVMLFDFIGFTPALCMLTVSTVGLILRRSTGLRWTLVILTFEGAMRIGLLFFLCGALWIRVT